MIDSFKIFESKTELQVGDSVVVKYKDSKYFMQTGEIISIKKNGHNDGDCSIRLDYTKNVVVFYKTNLEKIDTIVEIPSGEVMYMMYSNRIYLSSVNILKYDFDRGYYYFLSQDKWEVKDYIL